MQMEQNSMKRVLNQYLMSHSFIKELLKFVVLYFQKSFEKYFIYLNLLFLKNLTKSFEMTENLGFQ